MNIQLKEIPWYEWYYSVTKNWDVYSHRKKKFICQVDNTHWYLQVHLCVNGIHKTYKVHRLVLYTFLWKSDLTVNHKDGNKKNNHISNLEYCTQKENVKHSYDVLWITRTIKQRKIWWDSCRKRFSKRIWQYDKNGSLIKNWHNANDTENEWFIPSCITKCCRNERKSHRNFTWKYL